MTAFMSLYHYLSHHLKKLRNTFCFISLWTMVDFIVLSPLLFYFCQSMLPTLHFYGAHLFSFSLTYLIWYVIKSRPTIIIVIVIFIVRDVIIDFPCGFSNIDK